MNRNTIQTIALFILLSIYVGGISLLILYGAPLYRNMTARQEKDLNIQTSINYFNNRLKQSDIYDKVHLLNRNGITYLELDYDGYCLLIYESNGTLYEQYTESALLDLESAMPISQLTDLTMTMAEHTITIDFLDSNQKKHTIIYSRLSQNP